MAACNITEIDQVQVNKRGFHKILSGVKLEAGIMWSTFFFLGLFQTMIWVKWREFGGQVNVVQDALLT